MEKEIKIIETEDNKSENDNIIMPTGNCLFSNKYKKNNLKYNYNNIKTKIQIKDIDKTNNDSNYNNNKNLFSNLVLNKYFVDNKLNNFLKSTLIHNKDNNMSLVKTNKSINNIQNICTIKKNSIKFFKDNNYKKSYMQLSKKMKDKKIYKYNFLQKKLVNNNKQNIKDLSCDNNSFSIHYENRKDNYSHSNNLNNNTRLTSPKDSVTIIPEKNNNINRRTSLIYKKNIKYNTIDYNYNNNKIYSFFDKIKNPSARFNFSNISSVKNSMNSTRNVYNILLTPKNSYSKINFLSCDNKIEYQYNNKENNKTLLNDYNNISNFFHKKDICEDKKNMIKKFNKNQIQKFNKPFNASNIENYKNEDLKNYSNSNGKIQSSSLIIYKNISINKNKRVRSSYLRPNKLDYGFINSLSQNKLLNNKINNLKKYEIKENIISNILDDIQDNKFINNNLVSQLYKRPLINIYTLLELKNNDTNKNTKPD